MPTIETVVMYNGMWLLAPVMAWNILLTARLPAAFSREVFWREIPRAISIPENTLRIGLFALPGVTMFEVSSTEIAGWLAYGLGLAAYLASWLALIYRPQSWWSRHAVGFLAPAYTPSLWLAGVALSTTSYVGYEPWIRWTFVALSMGFLSFHVAHTTLIFRRESTKPTLPDHHFE
jgi:hypothetical protein